MDQLALEAAEEMPCHGVVVGIALAGHALPDSIERQPFPEGELRRIGCLVTVKDKSLGRGAAADYLSTASRVSVVSIGLEKAQPTLLPVHKPLTMAE